MAVEFANKVTKNIFRYHMTGFKRDVVYDTKSRMLMVINLETNKINYTNDVGDNLDFDDFVLVAINLYLDLLDKNQN